MIIEYQNIYSLQFEQLPFYKKEEIKHLKKNNENPFDHSQNITFSPNAVFSIKCDIEMYEKKSVKTCCSNVLQKVGGRLLLSYRLCSAKYTSSFYALYTVLKKVVCL